MPVMRRSAFLFENASLRKPAQIHPTRSTWKHILPAICLTILGASPAWADNIAAQGTGILGINDAIDSDAGTPLFHAGDATAINDGNPASHVDNYIAAGDHGTTN